MFRLVCVATAIVTLQVAALSYAQSSLPIPLPEFKGRASETLRDSIPNYPQIQGAPAEAPNVLLILLDDVGFGVSGTFGGAIATPTLDRLASNGLKFNRFHTTGLCSPTRAALLTGRNHHSVATGVITEMGTGFPGYTGMIPQNAATIAQILQANGYSTACFGKWHNTPESEISAAGPFDRWPTGLGFSHFYGFNQGETNQFHPTLYRNTTAVLQPKSAEEGYHFTTDITDEAIQWIRDSRGAKPNRPWFTYFAPGACHSPHQPPKEWREKFRGEYDFGWDRLRRTIFTKQRQSGNIPTETVMTLRPNEIPAWDELKPDDKKAASALMENFAAFMAHTDYEIGRLIDSLEKSGELENTLILYVVGDNGNSAEGGIYGTFNEVAALGGYNPGTEGIINRLDEIGGPNSNTNINAGWAWALSSPFKWMKQTASHLGATRNPLVVHWPKKIVAKNEIRSNFHHVIDIAPTILEAAGITAPTTVNGFTQKPIEGVSMVYCFDDKLAKETRRTQYFEIMGNRAIYHEGFLASAKHGTPWLTTGTNKRFDADRWELYDLSKDFSQFNDIAARSPVKVRELQQLFHEEAEKYNVYPLDDRLTQRLDPRLRTNPPYRLEWKFFGNRASVPEALGPIIAPLSHELTVKCTVPQQDPNGVLVCVGGENGGWSLFVKEGKLQFTYNFFGYEVSDFISTQTLPTDEPCEIKVVFTMNTQDFERPMTDGGTYKFLVNGNEQGELKINMATYRHGTEPFEVGRDSISAVSTHYKDQGSFDFKGTIDQVQFLSTISLSPF